MVCNSAGVVVATSADYVVVAADANTWHAFAMTTPPGFSNESYYAGLEQTTGVGGIGYFPVGTQGENRLSPLMNSLEPMIGVSIDRT